MVALESPDHESVLRHGKETDLKTKVRMCYTSREVKLRLVLW